MYSFSKKLDWWEFEILGSNFVLSLLCRRIGPTKNCLKKNSSQEKEMLDSFSVKMNPKSHSGFILPIPHNEQKSPTYVNNFLFAYNCRKQNICFALAVSAASTTECCYHIVPPFPNEKQPKTQQLFHIPHWHMAAWLQHHCWDPLSQVQAQHFPTPGTFQGKQQQSISWINHLSIPKVKGQIATFPRR